MAVLCKRYVVLMIVQGALCIRDSIPDQAKPLRSRYYEMDAEKLRDLWHNAMIRGLIKAHAKELLSSLPRIEQIVYQQCEKDARTTVALAKCAIRVFDARDNFRETEAPLNIKKPVLLRTFTARRRSDSNVNPLGVVTFNASSQVKKNKFFFKYSTYSSRSKLLNPIRAQTRRRGALLTLTNEVVEEREKGVKKEQTMRISKLKKRTKRAHRDEVNVGTSPNLRRVALKYVGNVLVLFLGYSLLRRREPVTSSHPPNNEPLEQDAERQLVLARVKFDTRDPRIPSHLENLRLIRDHFDRVEKINKYFKHMNELNRGLFESAALGIDSRAPKIVNNAVPAIEQVLAIVNAFSIITTNQRYQELMVDIVMDISGAGSVLQKLVADMRPEIEDIKNVKLPLVEQLSKKDAEWMQARTTFNDYQSKQYNEKGYAFLTEEQLNLVYSKDEQNLYGINTTNLGMMSERERVQRLEKDIRAMAALDRPKWPMWDSGSGGHEERINGVLYETLRPYAFTTLVGQGGVMEAVTLSPHAFVTELAYPEALMLQTLSPRAFVATILSPAALIARILSPTALRAEVLSPRALHAWVLSPEALVSLTAVAEVLSPRFLDPRVLSPEALVIDVLSPGKFFCNTLQLPTEINIYLNLILQILSPHILGGPHTHEEESHEVVEIGAHSPTRDSTELEHEEHESIHRGHSREEGEEGERSEESSE
ncbi:unnamed protein product [Strongylus vulgaris]|uniref:Uncharacterized protein n=1 Tax=Strongylus vulgaris TaxID=40348 RepID=A0A3P7IMR2_STRVU|nr:unnamed protein product [Strongylus vulgaris]